MNSLNKNEVWIQYCKNEAYRGDKKNNFIVFGTLVADRKKNKIKLIRQWFIKSTFNDESLRLPRNWGFIPNGKPSKSNETDLF